MNLAATIYIYSGGPGSGCNPEVGHCGRPRTNFGETATRWDGTTETKKFYSDTSNNYKPERLKLHDNFIYKYENKPSQKNPVIHLMAGGTASGKTTIATATGEMDYLRDPAVVNADIPRSELPEFPQVMGTQNGGLLQEEASDIRDKLLVAAAAHNNDIALDAVGSPTLAAKLDALEKNGYKVNVTYVHRPVEESISLAKERVTKSTNPADKRDVPEKDIRGTHAKARRAMPDLFKPGREVKIMDGTGKYDIKTLSNMVIYHRTADGRVLVKDGAALERLRNSEEPKIPDIF
jgi:predicted ABC-type ATPase